LELTSHLQASSRMLILQASGNPYNCNLQFSEARLRLWPMTGGASGAISILVLDDIWIAAYTSPWLVVNAVVGQGGVKEAWSPCAWR
jgi:hypothetical protein